MTTNANQSLYDLIRSYMHSLGASQTTVVALKSYMDAVRRLKCDAGEFSEMLTRLNTVIKDTEPRVIPLVHLVETFEQEMAVNGNLSLEEAKTRTVDILRRQMEGFEADTAAVTAHCMENIAQDDLIIVHSPTAYIRRALICTHVEKHRPFRVLALKQDFIRSRELITDLEHHHLDHVVIPEYNLSHYLHLANKLFIGAVSVTPDNQAVVGIGTANVVSLCHWYHVPVYLFVESIKFAHKSLADQRIYNEALETTEADFTFHMRVFSHDFINMDMVDHLVTEDGEILRPTLTANTV